MNPALIKMALDTKTSLDKPETTGRTRHDAELAIYRAEQRNKNLKTGFKIVLGAGLIFGIVKGIKKLQHNNSSKDNSAEMLFAKQISAAFGSNWDGTNEELLFQTAYQIQKSNIAFVKVQKAYKKLTNNDLLADLKSEVSAAEYAKFVNIVSSSNYKPEEDTQNPDYYSAGKIAVFKSSGGDFYKEASDVFSSNTLTEAGFVTDFLTTGITQMSWGTKMVKLKAVSYNNINWVKDEEVKLYPLSAISDLKKKGYSAYTLIKK